MNKASIAGIIALLIIGAIGASLVLREPQSQDVIRVADPHALGWAPFQVALEQKFFEDEDLRIDVIVVQTGDESLKALASGSVDVALAGIIPYSFVAFDSPSLRVIAQAMYAHDNQILARRDSGIATPTDIRGKRIGYAKTTASDIGIKQFLREHGIAESEVTLVATKPLAMPVALASGQIDAYSAWEPHIYNGRKLLGDDAVLFDDTKSVYTWHAAIISDERFVQAHTDELVRFMRAWASAEDFMREHPDETRVIMSRSTKIPEDVLVSIMPRYEFSLGLPDDVYTTIETDLAWANEQRAVPVKELPRARDLVETRVWTAYEKSANSR